MIEWRHLPGSPSKKLVGEVRQHLWSYLRARPEARNNNWLLAWKWAWGIEQATAVRRFGATRRRYWPSPVEIACQYLFLCMIDMRSSAMLRLPFDGAKHLPSEAIETINRCRQVTSSTNGFGGGFRAIEQQNVPLLGESSEVVNGVASE